MSAQILLLRGINVGGHGRLPMADLRAMLDDLGAGGAKTYLQSGNAVCRHAIDPDALADRIEAAHGFRRDVFAFTAPEWAACVVTNPFPTNAPKVLHAFFHHGGPLRICPETARLAKSERIHCAPGVVWLPAPDGIGTSKFAGSPNWAEGRPVTARNWNTVAAITRLLDTL